MLGRLDYGLILFFEFFGFLASLRGGPVRSSTGLFNDMCGGCLW
jgi:hypothetical protein